MVSSSGGSPRLSIVIPAADAGALEDTLVSVLENRPADCEIVVALAVPYADPWSIGDEVRFVPAPAGAGLIDCVNLGVASSRGEIVHVLAAGWRVTEGWAEAAVARFADPDVAAVVPVTLATADRGRVVAAGIRRTRGGRSVVNGPIRAGRRADVFTTDHVAAASAPAIEAGFWRADVLPRAGFSKVCGERLAAADMSATIACAGGRVVIESACRVVEGSTGGHGSAYRDGLHAERLFWRSLAGESFVPALLSHVGEVARHAIAAAPLGTLPMLCGRLAALVQFGSCIGRARELVALRNRSRSVAVDGVGRTLRIDAGHAVAARPRRPAGRVAGDEASGDEARLRRSA